MSLALPILLLMLAADPWAVPAGLDQVASAALDAWAQSANIADTDRPALHIGRGIPIFPIEDDQLDQFLTDKDPRKHIAQSNYQVAFAVLDGADSIVGSISVMCFADTRQPKAGVFQWGGTPFPFSAINEDHELVTASRILGAATWDSCRYLQGVSYLDASGRKKTWTSSSRIESVRVYDLVVLGKLTHLVEDAITLTEKDLLGPGEPRIRSFSTAEIEIERVLKGGPWQSKSAVICFPHRVNDAPLDCPPSVREGDRKVWFLSMRFVQILPIYLESDACALDVQYVDQVEREIERNAAASNH
jgi:hypothetical protein